MSVGASDAIVGKLKEAGAAKLTYTRYAPGLAPGAPKLPGQAPKATGLQGLLASLDGKKKMTTMEKSKYDWNNFKSTQDDHTLSQMKKASQDGYLEKMAFLARTDDRQAQVARSNRRRGMGLKD